VLRSFLPRPYKYFVAYFEKIYGITQKIAKRDIEIHIDTGLIVDDNGILKLKDLPLSKE